MTIDTANRYSTYRNGKVEEVQPKEDFETAHDLTREIVLLLWAGGVPSGAMQAALEDVTRIGMAHAVYGSNRIEGVGMGREETMRLCKHVFGGALGAWEDSPRCSEKLEAFLANDAEEDEGGILKRREVLQHALAFRYIVDAFVVRGEPLTQQLVLATHRILCDKIESASGHSSSKYAGMYRTRDAFAGTTRFTRPSHVHGAMASLIRNLTDDIEKAEKTHALDPFMMAAKYCDRFVNVHPFADGNGRVCRLVLNAILLRYAGVVVPLGVREGGTEGSDGYLQVAMRSGQSGGYPGELGTMVLRGGVGMLRRVRRRVVDAM
jgi:Fic family protein